ncbi:glycosyltransferase family 2 protein [Paenirhodobacter sp.]|uniref:glycosyltransferase family 2 protein n=1 Tax=Paenirhodobacter sp. TaxID=1965326 RepID=UPI003B3D72F0
MNGDLMPIGSLWIGGPLSWLEIASIRSFVDLGHDYVLYSYDPVPNLPEGARLADAREVWDSPGIVTHQKSGSPALHSDLFRVRMVQQTGRVWADTDIIALRPFRRDLGWYFGHERTDKLELGYAIFGLPPESRTLAGLHAFLTDPAPIPPWWPEKQQEKLRRQAGAGQPVAPGDMAWGTFGPRALTQFAETTGEINRAQPTGTFFPVSFQDRKALIDPKRADEVAATIEAAQSLCVHLYSRWLRKACARTPDGWPPRDSWLGRWCAAHGIGNYDTPPRDKGDFLADLEQRRTRVPGGPNVSRHGRVTIVTMAKDEGPYVLEWVAWHHLLGFTDILVYTNDCTDGTDELLDALAAHGLVTRLENAPWKDKPPQSRALHWAAENPLVRASDWLMVMDFDEFLSIRDGGVDDLLDTVTARGATAICCTWRFFGSNGLREFTPEPVTERMTRAAPEDYAKGYGIKTLYRNDPNLEMAIHRPYLRMRFARSPEGQDYPLPWLNGSGLPINGRNIRWRLRSGETGYALVQLNHYGVKSREEYLFRRMRGDVLDNHSKYDAEYFGLFDRNEVADPPRVTGLRACMARLAALPGVGAALALVEERRQEKLVRLRAMPGYAEQMEELRPLDLRTAMRLKRLQ